MIVEPEIVGADGAVNMCGYASKVGEHVIEQMAALKS
jgi:hypothetical protein